MRLCDNEFAKYIKLLSEAKRLTREQLKRCSMYKGNDNITRTKWGKFTSESRRFDHVFSSTYEEYIRLRGLE